MTSGAGIYADKVFTLYPNGFLPLIKSHIKDISFSAGINGALGKWKASLSNTFGVNHFDFTIANSVNYTQFATGNNVPTKFDAGGLQFLQNTINLDFTRHFTILQGLHIAQGAEFRVDQYTQRAGEEASYTNYTTASGAASGAQVFAGFVPDYARQHARHNIALYADLEQDLSSHWLIQAALRFENYSDFGSTLNYKIASRYKLGEHFSIRASASTGFRAPSVQQQYYAKTNTLFVSSNGNLLPVESGTFTNNSKPAQILGIPPLKEETSRNYAAGFSATPAKGLEISVDGYLININNRIVLTNNFTGGTDTALTRLLKENGATTANFFTNAIDTKSRGLELVLQYHRTFRGQHQFRITGAATFIKNEVKKGADGKPIIKASDVLLRSGQLGNYFNREDQSRIEVANPTVKANLSLSYNHKGLAVLCRLAYFGKVTYLDPGIDPSNPASFPVNAFTGQKETLDQVFSPKTITDLSVSYNLTRSFTLTAGANNLFDVYQDEQTHSGNVSLGRFIYSRRVEQMGFNGRYLFTRLSFNIHQYP
ncbi:MAG TPA: TonB-dependent receptor [Chitinophagaceae bacterium]|nr:TonB-dependent receptor [Chitinophagaceae bacterium]